RVEALERVVQAREVAERRRGLERLELVEVALGVFEVGPALDAGRAAEREPHALDAIAPGAARAVGDGRREDGGEVREEEVVLDQLPDGLEAILAGHLQQMIQGQTQ